MRINKFAGIAASTFFSGALVLGMATTAAAAPGFGSLGGAVDGCSTVVSTPGATGGWSAPADENAATYGPSAVAGPLGVDALLFEQSDKGTSWYKKADVKLSTLVDSEDKLTNIAFGYLTDGAAPALQLRITGASGVAGDGFATIVWSPAAGTGAWQTATPGESDQYWVTRDIKNEAGDVVLARGEKTTLKGIVAMNPDATLLEYGVQQSKENAAVDVAVDGFVFGCATTNFETKASPLGSLGGLFGGLS